VDRPWIAGVQNDEDQPFVVVLITDATTSSWTVGPHTAYTLVNKPGPTRGYVVLVDSRTCVILDTQPLPQKSFTVSPGLSPTNGNIAILLIPEAPTGASRPPDGACATNSAPHD